MLNRLQRFDEALVDFEKAIALKPDFAASLQQSRYRAARAQAVRRGAGELRPRHCAQSRICRGLLQSRDRAGRIEALERALASYEKAVACNPEQKYLKGDHLHAKMHLCDWTDFDVDCAELDAAVAKRNERLAAVSICCRSRRAPQTQFACARRFMSATVSGAVASRCGAANGTRMSGFASGMCRRDLRDHPVAVLAAGLFETSRSDRVSRRFAISFGAFDPDRMRARLKATFDRFIDVADHRRPGGRQACCGSWRSISRSI